MKHKYIISSVYLLLLFVILSSCSDPLPTNIELKEKSKELVVANNAFGFGLFENVLENAETDENLMISPLSVNQALSMALNGAKENTFLEMKSTLDFSGLSLPEINSSNQELYNALTDHDSKVELKIANSIWYKNNITPNETFIADNEVFYKAEVSSFDPANPENAVKKINKWVDDQTKGKIKKIVSQIDDEDVMFLINAVYFKAEWKTQFKKSSTELAEFTPENGKSKKVDTMIGEAELTYKNESSYSVIKLPYGSGKFNMVIYLPEEGYTTSDIVSELVNTDFETLNTMTPAKMDIWLPKFEFEYNNELTDELTAMGINDAFSPM
ncbi:MAG: serpin family protein, partial [Prolixibacteraceae bacterium]